MEDIKLRKKDIAEIVAAAYPDYTGRKFKLTFQKHYYMSDYWSGGSRTYVTAFQLQEGDLRMSTPSEAVSNPFNKEAHTEFDIPKDVALVEHTYFCGHDLGIRVVVHPETILVAKLLNEPKAVNL